MQDQFEIAAGTITGRLHRLCDRSNQDVFHSHCTEHSLIAIVADGCSSGQYSQIGAQLGVQLATQSLTAALLQSPHAQDADFWTQVRNTWLAQLRSLLSLIGDSGTVIQEYGLFTLVGACMTPEQTTVFAIGDGVVAVNGEFSILGPFPQNAPPYLAYGLGSFDSALSQLQLLKQMPTQAVNTLLIGTDGVQDLLNLADQPLPGRSERVPALSQFWDCDRNFRNPDAIRRQLALINRDHLQPEWEQQQMTLSPGLLPDDTTMVVIRRKLSLSRPLTSSFSPGGISC